MVSPLDYQADISLDEARERYREAEAVFRDIQSYYEGTLQQSSSVKPPMRDDHLKELSEIVGVLLPLAQQPSVQMELHETGDRNDTIRAKTHDLTQRILVYESNFGNSGVTVVHSPISFLDEFF